MGKALQAVKETEGILKTIVLESMTGKLNLSVFVVDSIKNNIFKNLETIKEELKGEKE